MNYIFLLLISISGFHSNALRYADGRFERAGYERGTKGESLNCKLIGGWFSGADYAVFVKDTFAYIGDGGYFTILNTKDPSNPALVGKISIPAPVKDIYVVDTLAYVADGVSGLRIIDVSNPSSPAEIGYYDTVVYSWNVYVQDTIAYIADDAGGLKIIDVSDPSSPQKISSYFLSMYTTDVYVKDTLAYVTSYIVVYGSKDDNGWLSILDVSDPSSPTEVGFYGISYWALGEYVQDTLAYVVDNNGGFSIIDVSDPDSLIRVGYYNTGNGIYSIYAKGSYAYVANDSVGLRIIDVSNPSLPKEVGYYNTGGNASDVYVKDSLAYVADGDDGLYIIQYTGNSGIEENNTRDRKDISPVSIRNVYKSLNISYALQKRSRVKIEVYNILGQNIGTPINGIQVAGKHTLNWDVNAGIYFVRYSIGSEKGVSKVIVLK